MTVIASAVLLPLGRATTKPCRVGTGAMPKASLDMRGRSRAVPLTVIASAVLLPLGRATAKPSRPVTVIAVVSLLPLGRATAKPSPVVIGAMPKASLGIDGDGAAEPSRDRDPRGRAPATGPAGRSRALSSSRRGRRFRVGLQRDRVPERPRSQNAERFASERHNLGSAQSRQ